MQAHTITTASDAASQQQAEGAGARKAAGAGGEAAAAAAAAENVASNTASNTAGKAAGAGGEAAAAENVASNTASNTAAKGASAAGKANTPKTPDTPEDLQKLLQTKIDEMKVTNDSITNEFNTLKGATAETIEEFVTKVDAAKKDLDAAIKDLTKYKKLLPQFPDGIVTNAHGTTGEALGGGSSSSKSKSKKKHRSYKSYHPEIGKTRKHHSHDDHKRVSFVHQA